MRDASVKHENHRPLKRDRGDGQRVDRGQDEPDKEQVEGERHP